MAHIPSDIVHIGVRVRRSYKRFASVQIVASETVYEGFDGCEGPFVQRQVAREDMH